MGWGEKEKGPTIIMAIMPPLTSSNTTIIMAESNILGITIHTVCIPSVSYMIISYTNYFKSYTPAL